MNKELQKCEIRSEVLKAMSHPTRLFIMRMISEKRYSVNEICNMIGCDLSTISKHINLLKKSGLVIGDKHGTTVYYSLKVPCIMDIIGCVDRVIKENAKEKLSF